MSDAGEVLNEVDLKKWYDETMGKLQALGDGFSGVAVPASKMDGSLQTCTYQAQMKLQEFHHWMNDFMAVMQRHTMEGRERIVAQAMEKGNVVDLNAKRNG